MREPVGWLLGPELIGKLRKIFRRRSDPRDWMPYYRGCVHDECWERDGSLVRVVPAQVPRTGGSEVGLAPAGGAGPAMAAQDASCEPGAESISAPAGPSRGARSEDVWFDYIADTGDGAESTYAVAYATMVSLEELPAETGTPRTHPELRPSKASSPSLPRGHFVFIGGDTAYHVADAPTLRARVQEPFDWAFEDAKSAEYIAAGGDPDQRTRRLYGIPGNHDWYDNLEGFSRVFRVGGAQAPKGPVAMAGAPGSDAAESGDPEAEGPIGLPELRRVQLASYVAIQLPHDWQLWGLDIDSPMDRRQRAYFESLAAVRPDRLIIATPSPAIAFGAVIADDHHREAVRGLGGAIPELESTPRATFPRYRLDLSGDVHHYARYYPNHEVATYGSVVSGLGGAFHHPSFMRATRPAGRAEAVVEYPTPEQSRERIGERLLTPASTWYGSWARVIPFALTLILGFAAHYSQGGGWLIDCIVSAIPGVEHHPVQGGGTALLCALCTAGVFLFAGGGVYAAIRLGRAIYARQLRAPEAVQNVVDLWKNRRHTPDWFRSLFSVHRSYWLAWLVAGVSLAAFALYPMWGPRSRTVRLDLAAAIVLAGLPIAGTIAAALVGGKHLANRDRIAVGVVGLFHALAQVATALLLAQMFTVDGWSAAGAGAAYALAAGALWPARWLFGEKERRYTFALAGLALAVLAGALALIVVCARGHVVSGDDALGDASWPWAAVRYAVSGVAAMPLGTAWFVWYLALAGRLSAHNNEVGGAARVTCFRQMIRFRITADGLTGYVIAIENAPRTDSAPADTAPHPARKAPHARGADLRFYLIDVFRIATPVQPQQAAGFGPPDPGGLESTFDRQ